MRYTIDETQFIGYRAEKLNWKQAISHGLELGGTIVAFTYALSLTWGTNIVLLMLSAFVLWLIYITNKVA